MSILNAIDTLTDPNELVIGKDISDIISLDPAEASEMSAGEIIANTYDRLLWSGHENSSESFTLGVASNWTICSKTKTICFKIETGHYFSSGDAVTSEDVQFSFERAVKLDRVQAFLFSQIGWTTENVLDRVVAKGRYELCVHYAGNLSPLVVLTVLSSGIASIINKRATLAHEQDGDFGHIWLSTNSAGSGPYILDEWKRSEFVALQRNPFHRGGNPPIPIIRVRHILEPSDQRQALTKGSIDIARDLQFRDSEALADYKDIIIQKNPKATCIYFAAHTQSPILSNPVVWEAKASQQLKDRITTQMANTGSQSNPVR